MEFLIITILNGIMHGFLLFMLSSGLTLIFGMMGILNFAHASFYMLGAYFAYQVTKATNFWIGLLMAPVLVGLLGGGVERFGLRKVHKHGHMAELLFTFGLSYLTVDLVKLVWGKLPVDYKIPKRLDFTLLTLFTTNVHMYKALIILISILIFISLFLLIRKTKIGMIIQAALFNPVMVNELGHNVSVIFMFVFAIGCALAGIPGVLTSLHALNPAISFDLTNKALIVLILAGVGSIKGVLIGGFFLGAIEVAGVYLVGTPYREVFGLILFVLILMFRPQGLAGKKA